MAYRKRIMTTMIVFCLLALLTACGGVDAGPPGTITGRVVGTGSEAGIADVQVILCRLAVKGGEPVLPTNPPVSNANFGAEEAFCELIAEPTAISGADGSFTIAGVPAGSYVLMYSSFPDKFSEIPASEWDKTEVSTVNLCQTDDPVNLVMNPCVMADPLFWSEGGLLAASANWAASAGFTAANGDVCSNTLSICFSLKDTMLANVIEVLPEQTVTVTIPIIVVSE